ncbi:MAG: uncharacterized SAM-binding protein YcdF (DUF218 family) [Alphaproteobacteria bacterium]|jgi:uncharacterized SAM-binding protein YcdF (DUF218 family)
MKSLVIAFFMPPGIGILLAFFAFYFIAIKNKTAIGSIFLFLAIVMGWAFSSEAMGRFLTVSLISQVEHRQDFGVKDVDIMVVLTGGMRYTGPTAGWLPEMDSYQRMVSALEVHAQVNSRTPILISGGKTAGPHYPSEAAVLRTQFDKQSARILPIKLEEISTNTYENALQSAHEINRRGAKKVLLVTSEEHMLRSLAAFRGRGIDPLPLRVFTMDRGALAWDDFFPSYTGVRTNARALYEIYAIVEYLLAERIRMDDVFYIKKEMKKG